MKGVFLLVILLAMLIVGYLLMSRINAPAPEAVQSTLGTTTIIDAPAKAKSMVDQSMEKEAERIRALEQENAD